MRHWLTAGEVARAAAVVGRIALEYLFRSGQVETVRRWLELFSDEQIQGDVPLTLVAGMVYSMSGDPRLGRLWVGAAVSEQVDDSLTPDGGTTLRGLQALLRAVMGAGGLARLREDTELAASPQVAAQPHVALGSRHPAGVCPLATRRRRWSAGSVATHGPRGTGL